MADAMPQQGRQDETDELLTPTGDQGAARRVVMRWPRTVSPVVSVGYLGYPVTSRAVVMKLKLIQAF
jgi:hypothetical protein